MIEEHLRYHVTNCALAVVVVVVVLHTRSVDVIIELSSRRVSFQKQCTLVWTLINSFVRIADDIWSSSPWNYLVTRWWVVWARDLLFIYIILSVVHGNCKTRTDSFVFPPEEWRERDIIKSNRRVLPPFVDTDVGRTSEPRIEDEDAPERRSTLESRSQAGVVMQTQSLPEPMHGVFRHFFLAHN